MLRAQIVEAVEQIAGGIGIVPVVAGVVDRDKVAGLLSKGAGALDQVVAGEQNFENRIAKGFVFAGEIDGGGEPARLLRIGALEAGQETAAASSCFPETPEGLCARRRRAPMEEICVSRSYFAIISRTSSTVE